MSQFHSIPLVDYNESIDNHKNNKKLSNGVIAGITISIAAVAGGLIYSYIKYQDQTLQRKKNVLQKSTRKSMKQSISNHTTTTNPSTSTSTVPTTVTAADSVASLSSSGLTDTSSYVISADSTIQSQLPDDESLRELLGQSLDSMNNTGQINENESLIDVLRVVSKSDVTQYSEQTRLVAAQWFVIYHTLKAIRLGGTESR